MSNKRGLQHPDWEELRAVTTDQPAPLVNRRAPRVYLVSLLLSLTTWLSVIVLHGRMTEAHAFGCGAALGVVWFVFVTVWPKRRDTDDHKHVTTFKVAAAWIGWITALHIIRRGFHGHHRRGGGSF